MSKPPEATFRGHLLVFLAAVLWSTSGFFAKAPDFVPWDGVSLAFWRAVFACVILFPMVRQITWNRRMIPMILCFVTMNYFFLSAMKLTEASNAIWLQNTSPIWVLLVNVFWLRESVTRLDWWMVGCGATGIAIILSFELGNAAPVGVVFGVISALSYSGVVLSLRGLRDADPAWLASLNHLATVIVLAPFAIHAQAWPEGRQWVLLALFGSIQMGLPYVLFAKGLKYIPSHEASGITLLEPILTPLWVFIAWSTHPSYQARRWWTLVGGAFILVGLGSRYLLPLRDRRRRAIQELPAEPDD